MQDDVSDKSQRIEDFDFLIGKDDIKNEFLSRHGILKYEFIDPDYISTEFEKFNILKVLKRAEVQMNGGDFPESFFRKMYEFDKEEDIIVHYKNVLLMDFNKFKMDADEFCRDDKKGNEHICDELLREDSLLSYLREIRELKNQKNILKLKRLVVSYIASVGKTEEFLEPLIEKIMNWTDLDSANNKVFDDIDLFLNDISDAREATRVIEDSNDFKSSMDVSLAPLFLFLDHLILDKNRKILELNFDAEEYYSGKETYEALHMFLIIYEKLDSRKESGFKFQINFKNLPFAENSLLKRVFDTLNCISFEKMQYETLKNIHDNNAKTDSKLHDKYFLLLKDMLPSDFLQDGEIDKTIRFNKALGVLKQKSVIHVNLINPRFTGTSYEKMVSNYISSQYQVRKFIFGVSFTNGDNYNALHHFTSLYRAPIVGSVEDHQDVEDVEAFGAKSETSYEESKHSSVDEDIDQIPFSRRCSVAKYGLIEKDEKKVSVSYHNQELVDQKSEKSEVSRMKPGTGEPEDSSFWKFYYSNSNFEFIAQMPEHIEQPVLEFIRVSLSELDERPVISLVSESPYTNYIMLETNCFKFEVNDADRVFYFDLKKELCSNEENQFLSKYLQPIPKDLKFHYVIKMHRFDQGVFNLLNLKLSKKRKTKYGSFQFELSINLNDFNKLIGDAEYYKIAIDKLRITVESENQKLDKRFTFQGKSLTFRLADCQTTKPMHEMRDCVRHWKSFIDDVEKSLDIAHSSVESIILELGNRKMNLYEYFEKQNLELKRGLNFKLVSSVDIFQPIFDAFDYKEFYAADSDSDEEDVNSFDDEYFVILSQISSSASSMEPTASDSLAFTTTSIFQNTPDHELNYYTLATPAYTPIQTKFEDIAKVPYAEIIKNYIFLLIIPIVMVFLILLLVIIEKSNTNLSKYKPKDTSGAIRAKRAEKDDKRNKAVHSNGVKSNPIAITELCPEL